MKRTRYLAYVFLLAGGVNLAAGYWMPAKAALAQILLRDSWRRTRSEEDVVRPWPWARTWPVARLEAPGGDDYVVLAGAEGAALAFAPGHVDGTPLPGEIGDERGNTVIAGHRDTVFAFLETIQLGDELTLETPDRRRHRFTVVDTRVVHESDVAVLSPTEELTLTLVTCYPFDAVIPGGPLRYVVRAVAHGMKRPPLTWTV